ncbi:Uncharacterized protein BM_BM2102 [Brugia malayi]|uniref:Protein orai n=3 Tax=Brugia TaxID=6278 RepID=A0A4E9F3N9_BRUMA|nr:Uncharacterized protein BM_BM2102 [Brugia malayi]VIO90451.1 Uncharacterized protein BM_BM2102 [Brugia malayi]
MEEMENKSMDDLLGATKELLSLWMTTYSNAALNNLSPHEIRNITASRRIESIGLKNFEAFFSNTRIEDDQQSKSMNALQCKFTPSTFDVNISNVTTSKFHSMTSSLHSHRSPSLCSTTTPNVSLDMHDQEMITFPQSGELNSDIGIQVGPESKLSAISSSSNTGNVPKFFEPTETLPPSNTPMSPLLYSLQKQYRGELSILEKYRYDLSRAQLKASSRTSALLAGFAMVALVELQYERTTPPFLLITLGVVTTLLVSVHLLALMMSTCILPYIEANGCTQDSPHIRLKFYIDLSWLFSTCIGLVLFLIEIGIIFFVKFYAVNYITAAYITTAMLIPVVVVFTIFSCLIHKNRFIHSINRVGSKAIDLQKFLNENNAAIGSSIPNTATATSIERHLDQKFTQTQKYWLDITAYIAMIRKLNYILINNIYGVCCFIKFQIF